ncbi:MAG: methyl-accepting chemotaxis protein [Betaproteobacteria bacterium HGW-Betaproteobacteria-12]|nr:MAG: methyl-accepting chemotaxis protein [Betaproteobacteria bacterium HGW-Betaproteobacteria-12]
MSGSKMTLRGKLTAMTFATIGALIILFVVLLLDGKQGMMDDRRNKLRNLVEVAHATVARYEQEVRNGALSEEEAKKQAIASIKTLRYDTVEYFWINDLGKPAPRMVMHPTVPALDGKVLDEARFNKATLAREGADGKETKLDNKNLFVAFVDVVDRAAHGFVEYQWPKPLAGGGASTELYTKLSYVKKFEPWGWVLGSGIYIDDVDAKFRADALKLLFWGLGIGGFIGVSLLLVSRNIIRTLGGDPATASEVTRRIAAGDLATPVNLRAGDSDSLLANIQSMQETLRQMIASVVSNAEQVSSAADELLHASEAVAERARQQSDAASSMAASVEEMSVSIDQVKENAAEAHGISQEAGAISQDGATVIHAAASEMRKISEAVQSSSTIVEDLGRQSDQITSIVKTIREIADQTNLLALNAAIEAARAGEQGRGFAVVADEVRKLAERTSLSTTEIGAMVEKIQSGTRSAVSSMQSGVEQVGNGVELANQAGDSINRIRDGAERVTHVVNGISDSIREQSTASNQIAHQLETIAQMSEQSAVAVRHTADAARQLHSLSASLHSTVAQFKT